MPPRGVPLCALNHLRIPLVQDGVNQEKIEPAGSPASFHEPACSFSQRLPQNQPSQLACVIVITLMPGMAPRAPVVDVAGQIIVVVAGSNRWICSPRGKNRLHCDEGGVLVFGVWWLGLRSLTLGTHLGVAY